MLPIHEGQCGLCAHFVEEHSGNQRLTQIRNSMEATEDFVDTCGHPIHERLHLKVTATSACDGFESALVH